MCSSAAARRLLSTSARRTNVLDSLKERGLVQEVTSSALRKHLDSPRTLYLGCDPTAPSLHLGNLIGLLALLHFQVHGHRAIALIGGATGSVGDPSGRSSERTALAPDALARNIASIEAQIRQLFKRGIPFAAGRLGTAAKEGSIEFKDNAEWTAKMSLLDFLSGPGKRARVGVMLSRDSVKNRLSTTGISFTEFSYQLLQAYDFYHLHRNEQCTIQLGGSDQWGNIQSGIEMIRREGLSQAELAKDDDAAGTQSQSTEETQPAYGLTWPLLTTAKGEKFGKSAGNAIWLDESLTSPFEFYQFFLRTQDEDVERYLHIFTFLDKKRIKSILNDHRMAPEKRRAQRSLAQEVTELVHGPQALERAETATRILFQYNPISTFSANVILDAFKGTPHHVRIPKKKLVGHSFANILLRAGLVSSKAQAKAATASKAISLNGKKVLHANTLVEESELLEGRVMVFGHGKSGLKVVEVEQA